MKKFILLISLLILIIPGCTGNTPDTIDLDATIQAKVSSALEQNPAVSQQDLDKALADQSAKISAEMDQKIGMMLTAMHDELTGQQELTPIGTPTLAIGSNVGATPTLALGSNENCVDKFAFIQDVTFPDGTMTLPRTTFTKSWYIQNTGTCTWNQRYRVVYVSGNDIGTAKEFPLFTSEKMLRSGESTVVSVKLAAPEALNTYTTYWALKSPSGKVFGGGDRQDVYLSSKFVVGSQYNFYENLGGGLCSDDSGQFFCGSSDRTSGRGVVYYASSPTVESNYAGQQSIMIAPPKIENGTTRLALGPVRFTRGTWLRATVSCPPNAPLCDNYVRLYVQADGNKEQLVTETEENNDGFASQWNIQLSDYGYHDQDVTFIFEVQAKGGSDNDDLIILQVPRLTDIPPVQ